MSEKHTTDKFVSIDRYYISGLHPHIWKHPEGEMVYFDDYVNLWAENARLKAEVERLTNENGNNFVLKEEWYLKCLSARAEVERLRASSFVTAVPVEQYERVVKAGDIIARIIAPPAHGPGEWDGEWYAWHNAKSGVLSDETTPNAPPTAL